MTYEKYIGFLTLFTAVVHLFLAIVTLSDDQTLGILFLLNFLGYLLLIGVLLIMADTVQSKTLLAISLAIYAFITIIAYVVVNFQGEISNLLSPLGIVTKLSELILIILIFLNLRQYENEEETS